MNIIVIGGGKVGYYLAKTLLEHGHYPTIIEQSKATCNFIANDLDIPIICGDGTSIETLEAANIKGSDALISVTGKDENNLISCQLAKKMFDVRKTIAKVNNPKNAQVMKQLGVDIVISSTNNIVHLLEREVDTSMIKQLVSISHGEASICEVNLPDNYALNGKKLHEIKLPNMCVVISINRDGSIIIPRGDTELKSKDTIMLMIKNDTTHDIKRLLKIEN
ncbi:NAD-binding protein [Paludicola sp. MB14-C6]|uniref:potassium channel family protein n=1 Tax=Paludihabitans sp. MB14-C6 TaxID=3070656 RepID=UPI0027DB7F94|nr:NAD-binding protein [Paludicola sp. MB14-C6]WMJ23816.1 NAD-binding protein [Paludicola sp. MB14-C6]